MIYHIRVIRNGAVLYHSELGLRPEFENRVLYHSHEEAQEVAWAVEHGAKNLYPEFEVFIVEETKRPDPHSLWRHRTGRLYRVLLISNKEAENIGYPETVVYMGEDGKFWSRALTDWHRSMTFVEQLGPTLQPLGYIMPGALNGNELAVDRTVLSKSKDDPTMLPVWITPTRKTSPAERWLIAKAQELGMEGQDLNDVLSFLNRLADCK